MSENGKRYTQSIKMSICIPTQAYEKLVELTDYLSLSKSGAIALALTRMYEAEEEKMRKETVIV